MIKIDEQKYQSCGSVIKSCKMELRKSTNVNNVCGNRNKERYFELCLFSKIYYVIKYFPELKQNIGIKEINLPLPSSSGAIDWKNGHIIEL